MLDHADPYLAFDEWYTEATAREVDVPNAMALATVDSDGVPSVRTVLMKALSAREGLQFFTNLMSRKAAAARAHPRVACVFHWKSLARQVVVEGHAVQVADDIADAYFATRPRGSQIGAWASHQGQTLDDRSALEAAVIDYEARFADAPVPRPPFWSGFRVEPDRFEFWQGRPDRLHDRTDYRRLGEGWARRTLSP